MKLFKMAVFIVPVVMLITSCSPNPIKPTDTLFPTLPQETVALSTPTATASQTALPSATSIPATMTLTPTPDYSQIKLYGTRDVRGGYGSLTLVILEMGNLQGEYFGMGDGNKYNCEFSEDFPSQLNCFGPIVPYQQKIKFSLFIPTSPDPVFNTTFSFTGPGPTPMGMYCEIEPLWTEVLNHIGNVGCYAVTCWINGTYYGGVQDSCKQYWPWIPPGLIPTALPTIVP